MTKNRDRAESLSINNAGCRPAAVVSLALLFSLAVSAASAQDTSQKWTLRDCIDYAVENNIEIRQEAIAVENAELELNTTRNSRLPDLGAGISQNFGFGRTTSQVDNSYLNTQDSYTSASISTSLPIFGGFRINNQVKVDKLDLAAATQGLEKAKQDLELNVAALYLDVLFKKEILAVYREQTALTLRQVENTSKMVEEGSAPRSQLYEIEAELASDRVNEVNAEGDLAFALLNLSQALNLEYSAGFDVADISTDELAVDNLAGVPSPDAVYEIAVDSKPSVRQAEHVLESSRYSVKVARSAWWPQIDLGASVGTGYYYMFGQPNSGVAYQLRNNLGENVGLNMSIPIFNRNRTRNSVRAAKLAVTGYSLALEAAKLALYKQIQQAWQGATSARASYDATLKALEATQESFRAMELRYENGKATVYEYSEAATNLISSKSEQTQAKYEFLFRTKILDFYRGLPITL